MHSSITFTVRRMSTLRVALIQLAVGSDKAKNLHNAVQFIGKAKEQGADLIALPECFNSPYGTKHFPQYAEDVPTGESCKTLSDAAKRFEIHVIGGTVPEKHGGKFYNTCTVWNPQGELVAKHRKMHLFDIDIKGQLTFKESEVLSPGDDLTTFEVKQWKIGIGICYDIRFEEMARLYRNKGCHMLIYPAAFNMTTGPKHWSLLQRARANDNQLYVSCVSASRDNDAAYVAWGHTQIVNPWGQIIQELRETEDMIVTDLDMKVVEEVRAQIPVFSQRRTDLYDTIWKKDQKDQ